MKKVLLSILILVSILTSASAATISGDSPWGKFNIEVKDGVPPSELILPGATTMSGSFPVTYDDGRTRFTFPLYFDDSTTLDDIVNALIGLFW
jgi:hypothetical protein